MITMQNVRKTYGNFTFEMSMELPEGQILGLIGKNGAGKSTAIKLILGLCRADEGSIRVFGHESKELPETLKQEIGVSLAESGFSGELTVNDVKHILKKMYHSFDENYFIQQGENLKLPMNKKIKEFSTGMKAKLRVLTAMTHHAKLLIMDEPTASLSGKEAETLFGIIEQLRERGVSIIYISHRLEEVYRLSDRLTVLRDGKNEVVLEHDDIDPKKVIQYMIGKVVDESSGSIKEMRKPTGDVLLKVENLSNVGNFSNINFELHKGEILGFGGLIGAGRTELVRAIYGIDSHTEGTITFDGQQNFKPSPKASIKAGFGFVPEDRRGQGFIPLLSTTRNVALTNYDIIKKNGLAINEKSELDMALHTIKSIDVRPNDPDKQVGLMSGGNQQKVVLGKWLERDLKILIVDEPTAGIDVGAKDEIYNILEQLAQKGVGIILVSSDLQELIRVSHRILVMRKGHIVKEFDHGMVTQAMVLEAGSGITTEEEAI